MHFLLGLFLVSAVPEAAESPESKSRNEKDELELWEFAAQKIRPGDRWIKVRIDIDEKGRPLKCGVIASNIRSKERRFWICLAVQKQWVTKPILKDGVPVATSVERTIVEPGRSTVEEWRKARKQSRTD
jgi:hypothetical protein